MCELQTWILHLGWLQCLLLQAGHVVSAPCDGVVCNNSGTCVEKTSETWWCECARGWTGLHCDLDACGEVIYLQFEHMIMSQNNDISKTGVDFYACSQLCEDNNCKSFDYEAHATRHKCNIAVTIDRHNLPSFFISYHNYDYYEPCGCNDFFSGVAYLHNQTLSPACYTSSTSSLVDLTCPSGHVFEDTQLRQRTVECTCVNSVGYPANVNTNCIPICDVMDTCQNGGTCTVVSEAASCICPGLTTGQNCEQTVDNCAGVICQNNGTCYSLNSQFLCMCTDEWTGRHCEEPVCSSMLYLAIPHKKLMESVTISLGTPMPAGHFSACLPPFSNIVESNRIYMENQEDKCILSYIEPKYNQWVENATFIDAPNFFYYEVCSGCNSSRQWYLEDTSNHTIDTCFSSQTGFSAQLTCFDGLIWSDMEERTRTINCSCKDETWPALNATCQRVDHCEEVVCENGGTCRSLIHTYICACTNEWTGQHCSVPLCADMRNLALPNRKLSDMGPDARNLSSQTAFETCHPLTYAHYYSAIKGIIGLKDICLVSQNGTQYDQWTSGVTLEDDDNFVYYEQCTGCQDNQPWYLMNVSNHTITRCHSSETGMNVDLKCGYGYLWPDTASDNRTLACSCETEMWQNLTVACEETDECADLTCQNGGMCQDMLGHAECLCPDGFTGRRCHLNQCSKMDLLKQKRMRLPAGVPGIYDMTIAGKLFASCQKECNQSSCKSFAYAHKTPTADMSCLVSISHDQWSGHQLEHDADHDYYEICEGCETTKPWYITSAQNHSVTCLATSTGFESILSCQEELYWSDTWQSNRTVQCSCQDEQWPEITAVCSEQPTTTLAVATTEQETTTVAMTTLEEVTTTADIAVTTIELEPSVLSSTDALDQTTNLPGVSSASTSDEVQVAPMTTTEMVTTEFPQTTEEPTTVLPGNCSYLPDIKLASVVSPSSVRLPVMQYESLTYRCAEDYYFGNKDKERTVTCIGLDRWTPYDSTCSKYFCIFPPGEDNAVSKWTSLTEGSSVTYECHDHYSFNTDPIISQYKIVCKHLLWHTLPAPKCIRRYCDPVEIANADMSTRDRISGTVLEVTCWSGYIFPDATRVRSMQCQNDGTWSSLLPDCQAATCSELESDNANTTLFQPDRTFGTAAQINCSDGYVLQTGLESHIYECSNAGQWSSDQQTCSEYTCPPSPYLQHAALISTGSVVTLKCNPGYRFYDGALTHSFDCVNGIQEVGRPPHICLDVTCPTAPNVTNAAKNSTAAIYGTAVRYTCQYGYWFPDRNFSKVITCTDHGNWTVNVMEDCIETLCQNISSLPGTSLNYTGISVDDQVHFYCTNASHRFLDGKKTKDLVCLYTGEWSELVSDCSDDRCSVIPSVGNATADTEIAKVGTLVMYHCNTGYQFPGDTSTAGIYCDRDSQSWNVSLPDCIALTCPNIPSIDHTTVEVSSYMYNGMAIYTCVQGSVLSSGAVSFNATCNEEGDWILESDDTACQAVFCPVIEFIENGYANGTSHVYGTFLELLCNSGYELERGVDSKVIQCTHLGQWSSEVKNCTLKQCPPVATWSGIMPQRQGFWYFGSTLNYTCYPNHTFADKAHFKLAFCDVHGNWDPNIEECSEIPDANFAVIPPTEAPGAFNVAIAAGSVTGVIFSMIVALDIASLIANSRQYIPRFRVR